MVGKLVFEDGTFFEGVSFGAPSSRAGEIVFSTGMVGYPESLTDPSYYGQILVLTYPIVGNYGVPDKKYWESDGIKVAGLVVSNYIDTPSHFQSKITLAKWFKDENVPLIEIKDTRFLTQKIRTKGAMLGKIIVDPERSRTGDIPFYDPNSENVVAKVSTKEIIEELPSRSILARGYQGVSLQNKTILLFDCGAKRNIRRSLLERGVRVLTAPWNFDPFSLGVKLEFNGVVISNGPGDPKQAKETIQIIKKILAKKIPTLGVCLGNQLLALAAGGDTAKLKFGHRSQNQPALLVGSNRCYITTQNHGFDVRKIPPGFKAWFINANDGSNEGLIHKTLPFMSVQFHPEATPGPTDCAWIFDEFLKKL